MEPKVILAIVGFIALAALIVVLLCHHYKNADGSVNREAVGKTIRKRMGYLNSYAYFLLLIPII